MTEQTYVEKYTDKLKSKHYKKAVVNVENMFKVRDMVTKKNKEHYNLAIINNITDPLLSIVMTTHERVPQTHYTIKTIGESAIKDRIQIIIVDDSEYTRLDYNVLAKYNMCIYHVKVKDKFWIGPGPNYNLGFQFVKAPHVVIQNSEVCHIGDVASFVSKNLEDNLYMTFDIAGTIDMGANNRLYQLEPSYDNAENIKPLLGSWLQSSKSRNLQYHFMAALTKNSLDKLGGFDYDLSYGYGYDDDEFILKIRNSKMDVKSVPIDTGVFGIHQWHTPSVNSWGQDLMFNNKLYYAKFAYMDKYGKFPHLTELGLEEAYEMLYQCFLLKS